MYNRCCRGNILLTAVMQGLHFKKILKKLSESIDKSVYWKKMKLIALKEVIYYLSSMKIICKRPWLVNMEKPQTFGWFLNILCLLILCFTLYHEIQWFTLFGYVLCQLSSIYLSTSHHNYARWMILCALELLNIAEMLRNGGFTINNRTGNPFENVGVDTAY